MKKVASTHVSKSELTKHFATSSANLHRFKWNFTHITKTTSISVTDAKFHKNLLFNLRDFQFFLTAVTNLSYRYDLLPCHSLILWWLLHLPAGTAPAHHTRETVALLSAETPDFISPLDWPHNSPDLNPVDYAIWDRKESIAARPVKSERTSGWRVASFWSEHYWQQWISGVIATA